MRRTVVAAFLLATFLAIEIPRPIAAMPVAMPAQLGVATTGVADDLQLAVWHHHYWHHHYWHRHYWRWHFPYFWVRPWYWHHWGWRHHHRHHHPIAPMPKEKPPEKPPEPAPPAPPAPPPSSAPEGQTKP